MNGGGDYCTCSWKMPKNGFVSGGQVVQEQGTGRVVCGQCASLGMKTSCMNLLQA